MTRQTCLPRTHRYRGKLKSIVYCLPSRMRSSSEWIIPAESGQRALYRKVYCNRESANRSKRGMVEDSYAERRLSSLVGAADRGHTRYIACLALRLDPT
jgi:hypothetical protein